MFPILFEIHKFGSMSFGARVGEIAAGVAMLLGWLALHLRGRRGGLAGVLNLGAFLVGAHLALSLVMKEEAKITIYSFGVIIILGFFAGATYILRHTRPLGLPDKKVFDFAFWMLVVGIAGSRLLYAFLNYDDFRDNNWEVLKIWHGGLVWYGGLIPAIPVGIWLLRRYGLPVLAMCDITAAAVMLALGIGRWACLLAGDDYGRPTDLPWAITFHHERCLVPHELRGVGLHPTQFYMSLNALWIFYFTDVVRRKSKYAGRAFAFMLGIYAISRAVFIEPYRGDFVERNPAYGKRAAVEVTLAKGESSPALRVERGQAVEDRSSGIRGTLLSSIDLPAGEARGSAWAMTDLPPPTVEGGVGQLRRRYLPPWEITAIQGVPPGVSISTGAVRWYNSDLPVPLGYVSTSQYIGIAVLAAAVLVWVLSGRLRTPPRPPQPPSGNM